MKLVKSKIKNNTLDKKQGIFFDGQFFDAYIFISDILKEAKESITLVDNYVDETTLLHLSSKSDNDIEINVITKTIYHLGASLKDLGNKWFAFSKLEDDNIELLNKVKRIIK